MKTKPSRSRSMPSKLVPWGLLLLGCGSTLTIVAQAPGEAQYDVEIPAADFVSRAKGIIRALYPGLDPPPVMRVLDGRAWEDPEVTNVFDVEFCGISRQQLSAEEPCPCPNPVLKANLGFEYRNKDKELADINLSGPAARGNQDRFWDLVRGHREWTEGQLLQALEGAGAKYGPDKKTQVIAGLPLAGLRPYMGELKVESARFYVTNPLNFMQRQDVWGECAWLVHVTARMPSKHEYHYGFVIEPFEGRVIYIWIILHATSPDFPSMPPDR